MITKAQIDEWEFEVARLRAEVQRLQHIVKESDVIIEAYAARISRLLNLPGAKEVEDEYLRVELKKIMERE